MRADARKRLLSLGSKPCPYAATLAGRLNAIVERVTYRPDYVFLVGRTEGMKYPFAQVMHWRPDAITGQHRWGKGGKAYVSEHATDSEIFQILFGLAKAYEEHEVREFFRVDGVRPFGPHISTEALCSVADQYDARPAGADA